MRIIIHIMGHIRALRDHYKAIILAALQGTLNQLRSHALATKGFGSFGVGQLNLLAFPEKFKKSYMAIVMKLKLFPFFINFKSTLVFHSK